MAVDQHQKCTRAGRDRFAHKVKAGKNAELALIEVLDDLCKGPLREAFREIEGLVQAATDAGVMTDRYCGPLIDAVDNEMRRIGAATVWKA